MYFGFGGRICYLNLRSNCMSNDIVIVFIFFAGPIRGYSPGGRVNNFYSHGRRVNSHFVAVIVYFRILSWLEKEVLWSILLNMSIIDAVIVEIPTQTILMVSIFVNVHVPRATITAEIFFFLVFFFF